jgi:nitroreductase
MTTPQLTAEELLTTTRAVRRRLNFKKAVPPEEIRKCIETALQAPTGGNTQGWQFVVVYDAAKRAAIADYYRQAWAKYKSAPGSVFDMAPVLTPANRALRRLVPVPDWRRVVTRVRHRNRERVDR